NGRSIGGALPQRINSCFAVLEQLLQTPHSVCSSLVLANQLVGLDKNQSILDYVSKVFGIKDIHSIPPTTSLVDLGMDSLMAVEVKQILETQYEYVLSMQELRSLTIQDLKDIENKVNPK